MAVRTSRYRSTGGLLEVRAVQITEKNLTDIVSYICRNGGAATGHTGHFYKPFFGSKEVIRPARIRIKQQNFGPNWSKIDWRVANVGDWIVRFPDDSFRRVKSSDFVKQYVAP